MSNTARLLALRLIVCLAIPGSLFAQTDSHQGAQGAAPAATQRPQLTPDQWREDLRFFATNIEKTHKNLFHTMSREQFQAAVKKLDERIPSLQDHEIVVELMRIVAMIGDGHTSVRIGDQFRSGVFPVKMYMYKDGLFIQTAAPEYREAVGARVVKIGNATAEQAMNAARDLVWRDNEMGVKAIAPNLLSIPEVLHTLRLTNELSKLDLVIEKDGRETKLELKPTGQLNQMRQIPASWIDAGAQAKVPTPLWRKDQGNFFWYEHLTVTGTPAAAGTRGGMLYVQFNAVQNKPEVDKKPGETVEAFFKRVFDYIETNQVDKLVLDIRLNGGGNNYLNLPITLGMIKSRVNKRGNLFVVLGRQTFSAAQNTVNELEKYTNAIFVGEPTSANPNHFGDARNITLPNSKVMVRASTLWWQDMDPRETRRWTAPEIAAEMTSSEYAANVDPAMTAILSYTPGKTLAEILEGVLSIPAGSANAGAGNGNGAGHGSASNLEAVIKEYRAYRANPAHAYINTETAMNQLGYNLLARQRIDEAIEIFKINVEDNPRSANVYDSLAEAYLTRGDRMQAIKFYSKALEIDPAFPSAVEALRRLKTN